MQKIKSSAELLELNRSGREYAGLMTRTELQHTLCLKEKTKCTPVWERRAIDMLLGAVVVGLIWYVVYMAGIELTRF